MTRYSNNNAHPMVVVFVFSLIVLTGITVSVSFNQKPRTLDSSAQVFIHRTPTPIDCERVGCEIKNWTTEISCESNKECQKKVQGSLCPTGFSFCNEIYSSRIVCSLFTNNRCRDKIACKDRSECPANWSCRNANTTSSKCVAP